jgi:hypothetical protein
VEAVADRPGETGRFAAVVTERWNVIGGRPNGGYVLGIALRALARVLPMPDPLVVSALFLRPALPGAVEIPHRGGPGRPPHRHRHRADAAGRQGDDAGDRLVLRSRRAGQAHRDAR